jgi:prepilin-type N-terminal cleavage/methylation domain-containing protein
VCCADRPGSRAGFTLAEVMVGLTLSSLLAGIVFQVVRGQSRFAQVQAARQEVQQNARAALAVLSGELRAAQAEGLVSADTASITFLLPRVWGVSCGGGTPTRLPAIFPGLPDPQAFALDGSSGLMGDAGPGDEVRWAQGRDGVRAAVTALTPLSPALGTPGNACEGIHPGAAVAEAVRAVAVTGSNLPDVPAGEVVYLHQLTRYDVAAVNGEPWIRRSLGASGPSSQQPLAGPLDGAGGLAFGYFRADGTRLPAPGSDRDRLAQVARIAITVSARSRAEGRTAQTDTEATSVLLRN